MNSSTRTRVMAAIGNSIVAREASLFHAKTDSLSKLSSDMLRLATEQINVWDDPYVHEVGDLVKKGQTRATERLAARYGLDVVEAFELIAERVGTRWFFNNPITSLSVE